MILCLDPSFTHFGCTVHDCYGNVIDAGTIVTAKTKKKLLRVADDDVQRITIITGKLSALMDHHGIEGVLSELPPSNSKSAAGAKGLGIAVALLVALVTERSLPIEWATPDEVKKALTGKKTASKEEMMTAACKLHDWKITERPVYAKKTKKLIRKDKTFYPAGKAMPKDQFEHVADTIGVFEALKHTNTARMLLKRRAA